METLAKPDAHDVWTTLTLRGGIHGTAWVCFDLDVTRRGQLRGRRRPPASCSDLDPSARGNRDPHRGADPDEPTRTDGNRNTVADSGSAADANSGSTSD